MLGDNGDTDEVRILDTKRVPIDPAIDKKRLENSTYRMKSMLSVGCIAVILLFSGFGFFIFDESSKKYLFCTSMITLIIGAVVGYLYGAATSDQSS